MPNEPEHREATSPLDPDVTPQDQEEPDWDPAAPKGGTSRGIDEETELGRTLTNYGEVEPGTSDPPKIETLDEVEIRAARGPAPVMPLEFSLARAFLDACMNSNPRVTYGLGKKVPFHGATPGSDFKRVDCSGFVRELIWRATNPRLNFKDGSVVQHDWIRAQGFTKSTKEAAMASDNAIRIAFLRPQDAPSGVGHVALVHNGRTLESHGGTGPNSRAWTISGWQSKTSVYLLTNPAS